MDLVSSRKFVFSDERYTEEVNIPEIAKAEYGMYTWPCAPVLAQYVWHNRSSIRNMSILELSAGTALPGVVAAKCGASVHFSDCREFPQCLENIRRSCEANGIQRPIIHGLTWGNIDHLSDLPHFDLIMSSDCFYDPHCFEDLIVTIACLLEMNNDCKFICSHQERDSSWNIEFLLHKWKLKATRIPLISFHGDSSAIAGSELPGNHTIHMFEIVLST